MNCILAKELMSSSLDADLTRCEFSELHEHLADCARCRERFAGLQRGHRLVSGLGRKKTPADLTLRLRVAISQEVARSRRSRWDGLRVRWENVFNAFMVPATAGVVTTVVVFGLLISFLVPTPLTASNDVPTGLYTPPQLQSSPFELGFDGAANSLVVEAYVGADGRVQDYRILSGAESAQAVLPELKNLLIFTTFQPATSFGRPISGRAILTFSKIQVRG